jgi:hypothetical protein
MLFRQHVVGYIFKGGGGGIDPFNVTPFALTCPGVNGTSSISSSSSLTVSPTVFAFMVGGVNDSGAAGSGASASAVSGATTAGNGVGVAVAFGVPPRGRENMSPGGFDNAPLVGFTFSDGGFENAIVGGFGKEDPAVVDGAAPLIVLVLPASAGGGANVVVADPGGLGNGDAGVVVVVVVPDGRENRLEASCLGVDRLGDGLAAAVAAGSAIALPNVAAGGGGNIKLFGSPPEPGDGAPGEVNLLAADDVATTGLGDMYGCGGGGALCTP